MADIKQELADAQAAVNKVAADVTAMTSAPAPAASPAVARVRLRHPLTGDVQDVDATPAALIPLMGRGYQQVKGA